MRVGGGGTFGRADKPGLLLRFPQGGKLWISALVSRRNVVQLGRIEGKLALCHLLLVWLCPAGGLQPELVKVTDLLISRGWAGVSPTLRYPGPLLLRFLWEEWLRPQRPQGLALEALRHGVLLMEKTQSQPRNLRAVTSSYKPSLVLSSRHPSLLECWFTSVS